MTDVRPPRSVLFADLGERIQQRPAGRFRKLLMAWLFEFREDRHDVTAVDCPGFRRFDDGGASVRESEENGKFDG